jgi:hypothetical protein
MPPAGPPVPCWPTRPGRRQAAEHTRPPRSGPTGPEHNATKSCSPHASLFSVHRPCRRLNDSLQLALGISPDPPAHPFSYSSHLQAGQPPKQKNRPSEGKRRGASRSKPPTQRDRKGSSAAPSPAIRCPWSVVVEALTRFDGIGCPMPGISSGKSRESPKSRSAVPGFTSPKRPEGCTDRAPCQPGTWPPTAHRVRSSRGSTRRRGARASRRACRR